MKRYRIMNRITKKFWEGEADSAEEACHRAGWPIGDCWVREFTTEKINPESGYMERPARR